MKLTQVQEDTLPIVFDTKDFNSLSKKPKKLKKGFYGVGGAAVGIHSNSCPSTTGGTCTCGASNTGSTGGTAGGAGGGGGGGAGGGS